MYDIIIAVPETRQMLLRRMRTLMDRFFRRRALRQSDLIGQQITTITTSFGTTPNWIASTGAGRRSAAHTVGGRICG